MACLELTCGNRKCNHVWFSNSVENCPKCGGTSVHAHFDEADDDGDRETEEDGDDV